MAWSLVTFSQCWDETKQWRIDPYCPPLPLLSLHCQSLTITLVTVIITPFNQHQENIYKLYLLFFETKSIFHRHFHWVTASFKFTIPSVNILSTISCLIKLIAFYTQPGQCRGDDSYLIINKLKLFLWALWSSHDYNIHKWDIHQRVAYCTNTSLWSDILATQMRASAI